MLSLNEIEKNSRNTIILLGLHNLLVQRSSVNYIEQGKKKLWSITAEDSYKFFLILSSSINAINNDVAVRKEFLRTRNLTFQPTIFCAGSSIQNITSDFFIYFDNIIYKFKTITEATENLIKIYNVFNLSYPINRSFYIFMSFTLKD